MDEFTQRMNDSLAMQIGQLILDKTAVQIQLGLANEEIARARAEKLTPEDDTPAK